MPKINIIDYIPIGRDNAVTRSYLAAVTGLRDRQIRDAIAKARRDNVIINTQDGKGYYRLVGNGDKWTFWEKYEVVMFERQETRRLESIGWSLKAVREAVKKINIHGL